MTVVIERFRERRSCTKESMGVCEVFNKILLVGFCPYSNTLHKGGHDEMEDDRGNIPSVSSHPF